MRSQESPKKHGRNASLILIFTAVIFTGLWLAARVLTLEAELRTVRADLELEEAIELAGPMAALQRFAGKLHHAGMAQHWELAGFYLHEIEETADEIVRHNLVEDDVALTPLMEAMLLPAVEQLEQAVVAEDPATFGARYEQLVSNCNACHQATKHAFIRITVPKGDMFPNQDFTRPSPPL